MIILTFGFLEVPLKTKTLKSILDQYLLKNQTIDFMTIDVEGLDFEVLSSNDWNKYRPTILLIEYLDFESNNFINSKLYQYMLGLNYSFYAKTNNTFFFKNNKYCENIPNP
jgi:hypothetical protein